MELHDILEQVKAGALSPAEAATRIKNQPYEDIGFAKLDYHRQLRRGFGEVVYCAGKTIPQTVEIFSRFVNQQQNILGTRASREQYEAVAKLLPGSRWDEDARTILHYSQPPQPAGAVAVCTGGTADIPVAQEAAVTAEFFGARVKRIFDVGVAGIHRLFDNLEAIQSCNCVVAVAGMEGALAGVIAGLVDIPVVAVPTSVGYGASFGGMAPLLTMLNSCAEGVATVNIDNGFGAGYLAAQINRLATKGGVTE